MNKTIRKLKKLLFKPGYYFRDLLIKKYPLSYGSYNVDLEDSVSQENFERNLLNVDEYNGDIDVVYTWVDDKDSKWLKNKSIYQDKKEVQKNNYLSDGLSDFRFNNHDELFYSIRSVQKFMPWVNNIYIVTDAQKPKIDDYHNVYIVDHRDIIEGKYLPTFNSHVIEANLYKIDGLSENFIYFNDDVFVAKPLEKKHFFQRNGLGSIFFSGRSLIAQKISQRITPTLYASLNSVKILSDFFKIDSKEIDKPLLHTYIPLKKSLFAECSEIFNEKIKDFLPNKFRSANDINTASFLVPWFSYLKGKLFGNVDICYYMNLNSPSFAANIIDLVNKIGTKYAPNSFCINDVEADDSSTNIDLYLSSMKKMFGDRCE